MTNNVDTIDASVELAQPIELYEFTYGTDSFNYCTGGNNQVIKGKYYKAVSINRKSFTRTDNLLKGGLKIQLDRETEVGRLAFAGLDEKVLSFKLFRADLNYPEEKYLTYSGKVVSYSIDELSATLDVEPPSTIATRNGFTPKYQRQCRHLLFSRGCALAKNDWTYKKPIVAISDNVIQIYWSFLFIENANFLTNGQIFYNGYYRKIIKASLLNGGNIELTLNNPIVGLVVGDIVDVTYGCNQTRSHCHNVFSNTNNYGGFDFIPAKNPFGGTRVF
ncbi:TPA: phage BR0599 family protein [Vibrio parahaemolyticus]|nr:phage BR0599 family protein [Vibrio parahaemolyticus]